MFAFQKDKQLSGVKGLESKGTSNTVAAHKLLLEIRPTTAPLISPAEITSCIYAQQVFPESDLTEAGLSSGKGINSKNRDGPLTPGRGNKNTTAIWTVDH